MASITVSSDNPNYDSRNNCNAIIQTSSNALIAGCKNTIIPDDITTIAPVAFGGCTDLTNVVLPNTVNEIWDDAFAGCTSLSSITIGSDVTTIYEGAFRECTGLTDFYCLAENVPSTNANAFKDSPIANATLHVPAESVDTYKAAEPWKNFGNYVGINGTLPDKPKCATPTIKYIGGKLKFECETEGVEFVSHFSTPSGADNNTSEVEIPTTYTVSVHAKKDGYLDSETVTADIDVRGLKGDVDGDGEVDIADAVHIVNYVVGKISALAPRSEMNMTEPE